MAKTERTSSKETLPRSSQSGQFLGVAKDGTPIARPDFKPVSFTERELNRVIRDLRSREQSAKAG